MKICELLELIDENQLVNVTSADTGEIIACYDGRNSIPRGLDPCIVRKIRTDYAVYALEIQI